MVDEHYQIDGDHLPRELSQTGGAEEALTALRELAEGAAEKMEEILKSSEIQDSVKVAVIMMVLDRVYGKPEEMLKLADHTRSEAEAAERLHSAAAKLKLRILGSEESRCF